MNCPFCEHVLILDRASDDKIIECACCDKMLELVSCTDGSVRLIEVSNIQFDSGNSSEACTDA